MIKKGLQLFIALFVIGWGISALIAEEEAMLSTTHMLQVKVIDADHQPVLGAEVTIVFRRGFAGPIELFRGLTDENGMASAKVDSSFIQSDIGVDITATLGDQRGEETITELVNHVTLMIE